MHYKIFTFICLALLMSQSLFSQEGFRIGLRVSPVFFASTDIEDPRTVGVPSLKNIDQFGIGGGLAFTIGLGKALAIKSGVGLNSLKFKNEATIDDGMGNSVTIETESRFNFLEIPLGLKLRIPLFGGVAPYIGADFIAQTAFDGKEAFNNLFGNDSSSGSNELDINNFVIGFAPNAGIDIGKFSFAARYNLNLTKFERNDNGQTAKLNYMAIDAMFFF